MYKLIISNKGCCELCRYLFIYSCISSHIISYLTSLSSSLSLLLHTLMEAILINLYARLKKNLLSKVKRKSICVIKLKCILSTKHIQTICLNIIHKTIQYRKSLVYSLVEILFLCVKCSKYMLLLLQKLRISIL